MDVRPKLEQKKQHTKNEAQQPVSRPVPTVDVFGIPISTLDRNETVDYIANCINERKSLHVITNNPIMLMHGLEHPDFYQVLKQADLHVPDGTGLVWAAGVLAEGVKERVPGIDLMHDLLERGENYGWRVFLLGASAEVVEETAGRIAAKYPRIQVVGWHDGFFSPDEDESIVRRIREASPELLFVARSLEMQEGWIAANRQKLNVPCMMGVGGSFDVIAGKVKRAPLLLQKMRLEWFYRLLRQPSRLTRMLVLPRFVLRVEREKQKRSRA